MKPDKLWEHVVKGGEVAQASPPSDVILAVYQEHKCIPPRNVMEETAKKVLLSLEEVEMWFQHLQQTSEIEHMEQKRQPKHGKETPVSNQLELKTEAANQMQCYKRRTQQSSRLKQVHLL